MVLTIYALLVASWDGFFEWTVGDVALDERPNAAPWRVTGHNEPFGELTAGSPMNLAIRMMVRDQRG